MNEKLEDLHLHIPIWATEPIDLFIHLFFLCEEGFDLKIMDGPLLNSKESWAGNSRLRLSQIYWKGMFGILISFGEKNFGYNI